MILLKSLFAGVVSTAFCITFNTRGKNIFLTGLCGGVGYLVYLLTGGPGSYSSFFIAGIAITTMAEVTARIIKSPTTVFLVGGLLPLVPGGDLFRFFQAVMQGSQNLALYHILNTIVKAGALAAGTIMIGALLHITKLIKKNDTA